MQLVVQIRQRLTDVSVDFWVPHCFASATTHVKSLWGWPPQLVLWSFSSGMRSSLQGPHTLVGAEASEDKQVRPLRLMIKAQRTKGQLERKSLVGVVVLCYS